MPCSGMDAFYAQLVNQVSHLCSQAELPLTMANNRNQSLRRELLSSEHEMTLKAHVFEYVVPASGNVLEKVDHCGRILRLTSLPHILPTIPGWLRHWQQPHPLASIDCSLCHHHHEGLPFHVMP